MKIDSPNAIGVSTGFGIPTGGTQGQYLVKDSTTDYDTSWTSFGTPTYIQAGNSSGQAIPYAVLTTITNWTNFVTSNSSEWNPITGVFTATKSGTYFVSVYISYTISTPNVGSEYNVSIVKNGVPYLTAWEFVETTSSLIRSVGTASGIVSLSVGDTISVGTFQQLNTSGTVSLRNRQDVNLLTIQELPTGIKR